MSTYPQFLKHYSALEQIGSGGIADVFSAYDPSARICVVLKTLRAEFQTDAQKCLVLRNEAKLQSRVQDAAVVEVYDYLEEDGLCWLVEEYMPGLTLRDAIFTRGKMDSREALRLCREVCLGAAVVHQAGIVHNDLKPLNYIFSADDRLKLTDFSEARAVDAIETGGMLGQGWVSPLYMSPEQAAGLSTTCCSDVYSLGVIFYQLLCGSLPFFSEDFDEMTRQQMLCVPRLPRELNHLLDERLEKLIMKMLDKLPRKRFADAGEVLCELNSILP